MTVNDRLAFFKRAAAALAMVLATAVAGSAPAHASDSYRSLTENGNPDWMAGIAGGANLAELSIPGTHDTMAVWGGDAYQTQERHEDGSGVGGGSLRFQLGAGIRAIDIRVKIVSDENHNAAFAIHHADVYQEANFSDVLRELRNFLGAHRGETVLLNLHAECTGKDAIGSCKDADPCTSCNKDMGVRHEEIFNGYRDANRDLFWMPSATGAVQIPTLEEVRGKVVLVNFSGPFGGNHTSYGFSQLNYEGWSDENGPQKNCYVQDTYNVKDISSINDKWEKAHRLLDQTNRSTDCRDASQPNANKMYVNWTSGSGAAAAYYTVAGGTPTATGVNGFYLDCLINQKNRCDSASIHRTGVVMMDFPGWKIVSFMIDRNPRPIGGRRIMIVGDSISQGLEGDFTWRFRLEQHLRSQGLGVEFVGPHHGTRAMPLAESNNPGPNFDGAYRDRISFDSDHDAQWGWQVHQAKDVMFQTVADNRPDWLLVELGFNDLGWFVNGPEGTRNDMITLINEARRANPRIAILVANVVTRSPISGREDLPGLVNNYNSLIVGTLSGLSSSQSPIRLVDINRTFVYGTDAYDGLHPNESGEFKIAAAFADGLRAMGLGSTTLNTPANIPALALSVPSSISPVANKAGITVSWSHVFGAGGYILWQRDTTIGQDWQKGAYTIAADSHLANWLLDGHNYEFRVQAVRGDLPPTGFSPVASAIAHPELPPPPPGVVSGTGPGFIDLFWGPPSGQFADQCNGFDVLYFDQSVPGSFLNTIHVASKSTLQYHITGLISGHTYALAVAATSAVGQGLPAGTAAVTVP